MPSANVIPASPHVPQTTPITNEQPVALTAPPSRYGSVPPVPAYAPGDVRRIIPVEKAGNGTTRRRDNSMTPSINELSDRLRSLGLNCPGAVRIDLVNQGYGTNRLSVKDILLDSSASASQKVDRVRVIPGLAGALPSQVPPLPLPNYPLTASGPSIYDFPLDPSAASASSSTESPSAGTRVVGVEDKCYQCHLSILEGDYLQLANLNLYHSKCFTCKACQGQFVTGKYVVDIEDGGNVWHASVSLFFFFL
jgi:hypothetical protein